MSGVQASSSGAGRLVTIGISTFNRVDSTFPEALRSALAQDYPHVELVVCDNASTDGTEAFMATQADERLRYHRHSHNVGANGNFNACLEQARGEYFLLLHDDDVLAPGFVRRAMAELGDGEAGVLLGGVRRIDAEGRVTGEVPAPPAGLTTAELFMSWFDRRISFYFCSTLFHTARLRSDGGFATPEDLFQDVVAIARLASRSGYAAVPGVGGHFRKHDANRGAASAALRWARDGKFLLEVLCRELPADCDRLRAAGEIYLANKTYRAVAAVPSRSERRELYAEADRLFGGALPPWRFKLRRHRRLLGRSLGRWVRRASIAAKRRG